MKLFLKKILLFLSAIFAVALHADLYENTYTLTKDMNKSGDFVEIVRFNRIDFTNGVDEKSIKNIINQIKSYDKKNKKIDISIIAYTQRVTDDSNEKMIDSKTYANKIQNWFRSSYDTNQSSQDSKTFATLVQKLMLDNNISKDIITVEYRGSKDLAFSDATDNGIALSNRVMITMYVSVDVDADRDEDGVFDYKDECLNTPKGVKVDEMGCAVDSDRDGVADYKDKCADTPIAAEVDADGCSLDSDKDGVFDYADVCPNTPLGVEVDIRGCLLKNTLSILFKVGSDKILSSSSSAIKEFATSMKKYPTTKVKITGHTDSVGKATKNMLLSQNRAYNTKMALVSEGVEKARILTYGRGELDPVKTNRTKEGRKANRRIEVELFY